MSSFPLLAPEHEAPRPRVRPRAADLRADLLRARPELSSDAPELQAAVILLLLCDIGRNVDRLVLRSGYPRDFVARCLRRLADNAWWVDGEAQCTWRDDPMQSRDLWLDVEVALGRCLRRIGDNGAPEWAPVGEWLKAFEYRGPHSGGESLSNQYRQVELHDPEPVLPSDVEDEEPEEVAPPPRRAAQPQPAREPAALPASVGWIGGSPAPAPQPAQPAAQKTPSFLVDEWTGANWLR